MMAEILHAVAGSCWEILGVSPLSPALAGKMTCRQSKLLILKIYQEFLGLLLGQEDHSVATGGIRIAHESFH